MKESDIEALKQDFDYNVEKADQEGAFWARLFAMSVNVFIRKLMGRRHFDRAVFMVMAIILPILMALSNDVINTVTNGEQGDFPIIVFVFLWFCFAIYRKFETRRFTNIEGVRLHGKYRGMPFKFWGKLPFLAPHTWEAIAVGLVGYLISFYPYTNLDLLLYGAALGKFLFETVDRSARREAEMDEQDANLATENLFYSMDDGKEQVQEYDSISKWDSSEGKAVSSHKSSGYVSMMPDKRRKKRTPSKRKNKVSNSSVEPDESKQEWVHNDDVEFDINKHKPPKAND